MGTRPASSNGDRSTRSGPAGEIVGSSQPRIATEPLRALTPDTSYGYDVIEFAEIIGLPLREWQKNAAIRIGELLPDGRPRFRTIVLIVARQNGKTHLALVFVLYWLFVAQSRCVLGMSTDRSYAKAAWRTACDEVRTNPVYARDLPARPVITQMGEEELRTLYGKYVFAANNARAGRSLTVRHLLVDELRQHANWDAWAAATYAMNAVTAGQVLAITNQGDLTSVVLNELRAAALEYQATGRGDERLGLIEWSAPEGSSPVDLQALAAANPELGGLIHPDNLVGAGERALIAGGEQLARHLTEVLCIAVDAMDPAVDAAAWAASATDDPLSLDGHRDRVCLCFDLSLDGRHATIAAAAEIDGVVHAEVVEAYDGPGASAALRAGLPQIAKRVRGAAVGWYPAGPAAAVASELRVAAGQRRSWAPRRTKVRELVAETTAVCMGLADVVESGQLRQPRDALLSEHVRRARRLPRGDGGWVFTRRDAGGPIDAVYALAGAVHLARSMPPPKPPM
jgi:hypothetical protein